MDAVTASETYTEIKAERDRKGSRESKPDQYDYSGAKTNGKELIRLRRSKSGQLMAGLPEDSSRS